MATDHTTLTIHGLDEDNKLVRAAVFAQKLRALISGLQQADKLANGKLLHDFIITEMRVSSAVVQIRERQRTSEIPKHSGIATYQRAVKAVYQGDKAAERLPERLVSSIAALSSGADKRFAHAEIGEGDNIVRIDQYMFKQAVRAKQAAQLVAHASNAPFFSGAAVSSFDGVLQLLDSRGTALLTKLTLTASGKEIDCVVNREHIPEYRQFFEKRVLVEGQAHYNGRSAIPERVDAARIKELKASPDLVRWRGAFARGA